MATLVLCACSSTSPGPVQEEWAKPGSEAFCITEKGATGIRYSVAAFYPPAHGPFHVEKIELPAGATNVRMLGVKATQTSGLTLDTGYGWPNDVDAAVNKQFKPETWKDLSDFTVASREQGRVEIFVGVERVDRTQPAVLPGVVMTYTADGATYTITSVAYMLIDDAATCAGDSWRKKLPAAQ